LTSTPRDPPPNPSVPERHPVSELSASIEYRAFFHRRGYCASLGFSPFQRCTQCVLFLSFHDERVSNPCSQSPAPPPCGAGSLPSPPTCASLAPDQVTGIFFFVSHPPGFPQRALISQYFFRDSTRKGIHKRTFPSSTHQPPRSSNPFRYRKKLATRKYPGFGRISSGIPSLRRGEHGCCREKRIHRSKDSLL